MATTVGIFAGEVMTDIVEHFQTTENSEIEKPLFVRIKRKVYQDCIDAFWLEINERPLKRPFLDLQKLSISNSTSGDDKKSKKVFMQHVKTVESSEASADILRSYRPFWADADECDGDTERKGGRSIFRNENKQEHLLYKAREKQEKMAKNARFKQIWRKRRGENGGMDVYDVVRVDSEGIPITKNDRDVLSLEDQAILHKFLPLLREYIPSAATEIEADIRPCSHGHTSADGEDHVYDLYAVKLGSDIVEDDISNPFPLVQVDEDDSYDDVYEEEYGSDDSNAEENPRNDYPDEETSGAGDGSETQDEDSYYGSSSEDSEGATGGGEDGDDASSEEKWKWSYR